MPAGFDYAAHMPQVKWVFSGLLSVGLMSAASVAVAEPFTNQQLTLAGGPRYGADNLNFGIGAGGGYTLKQRLYLGAAVDYFFGERTERAFEGEIRDTRFSALFIMPELGYDLGLGSAFVLRPSLGAGWASRFYETCTDGLFGIECTDTTNTELTATAAARLLFDWDGVLIGGELKALFGEFEAVWAGASVGMTL